MYVNVIAIQISVTFLGLSLHCRESKNIR